MGNNSTIEGIGEMTPEEMQEKVCGPKMDGIITEVKDTKKYVRTIDDRVFKDNGSLSISSRIRKIEEAGKSGMSFTMPNGSKIDGIRDPLRLAVSLGIVFLVAEKLGLIGAIKTLLASQ